MNRCTQPLVSAPSICSDGAPGAISRNCAVDLIRSFVLHQSSSHLCDMHALSRNSAGQYVLLCVALSVIMIPTTSLTWRCNWQAA